MENKYDSSEAKDAAVALMDDDLREQVHGEGFEEFHSFLARYDELHLAKFDEEFTPFN